jgi:DNA mismatch repair protein MutS2
MTTGGATGDALKDLEFALVLDQVAAHAAGELGAASVRGRVPTTELEWIRSELALVEQAAGLIRVRQGVVPEPAPDLTQPLGRLRVEGSVLEIADLLAIKGSLVAARLVSGELKRVEKDAPLVAALNRPLPSRGIERRLETSFDTDGYLLDTASPGLAAARKEVRAARERLIKKLEALLRATEGAASGENSVTVRNGRYVIPLRRDARQRPGGIVHDESASGGTLFVEPAETIELGNALRAAEAAEDREVLKVLRELTALLRPELEIIREAHAMTVVVDDLVARARYAVLVEGEKPAIQAAGTELVIRNGRHPLLFGGKVIPFDLDLAAQERTVLISGPNTGGKTVLLKAVGLISALAQSGIIPPVGPGTRLPVFQGFFADIGDRQSIAASLSTFSAHVQALRRILLEADSASLVLLDEVGSGTDPAEGSALAGAALASLTRRGAITLASTHLGSLKQLAAAMPGVVNASLEFDAATLSPTYRFLKGVPGRSYGLAIARRLGVPAEVLNDAEAQVPDAERHLDAVLATLERRERELGERESALEERASGLEALTARLTQESADQAARDADLARREKEAERLGRKEAKSYLMDARRRVEAAISSVQSSAAEEAAAREARRMVEEGIQAESKALRQAEVEDRTARPQVTLFVGQRVQVGQGGIGAVQEIRPDGKLVVAVGSVRMVVDSAAVTPAAHESKKKSGSTASGSGTGPTAPSEIDLRGLTGDEAETATLAAVDAAFLADLPYLRIIHGMGTGVVRERVRRVVSSDRRIKTFGNAPAKQGGTGVTIVEFTA